MDGVAFHDPMHEATKKPLTTVAACHCSPYSPGRQSRPHLFHVVRKVCTKSGHVSTIPPVVKNNSHHGISTIKSDYPKNGVANGWQKNYNSQGALMGEIMMKNGRATGEFRAYDSRGNIVQEGTHEDNVVSTVKGMSSPRPEPNEVSPNDNGGIMIKEVNE